MTKKFDLVAIGTGSSASAVASRFRAAGWQVAIGWRWDRRSNQSLRSCDAKRRSLPATLKLLGRISNTTAKVVRKGWPKMTRYLTISLALALFPAVRPLHAASLPRAKSAEQGTVVWTNEDLERLRGLGLISVVGQVPEEATPGAAATSPYVRTQDPEWYAEQASKLRAELKSREARLQHYRQALEDVRNLKTTTGGISLDEGRCRHYSRSRH
jgi:hypothetical protein